MVTASANAGNTASLGHVQEPGVDGRQGAENQNSGCNFCKKVASVSRFLFQATGATALVAIAATNPTITSALSSAFSKVGAAFDQGGAFVSANLTSFALGSMAAGALNVIDGVTTVVVNARKSCTLSNVNRDLPANQNRAASFSRLKKMYASAQVRGALQTAVGVTAVALGALALAGVVSNPFGLAAVGGAASLVLVGAQIHKFIQSRRIKAEMVRFNATLPPAVNETQGTDSDGNNLLSRSNSSAHSSSSASSQLGNLNASFAFDNVVGDVSPGPAHTPSISDPLIVQSSTAHRRKHYQPDLSTIQSVNQDTQDIDSGDDDALLPSSRFAFVHEAETTVSPGPTPRSRDFSSVDGDDDQYGGNDSPRSVRSAVASTSGRNG